MIGIDVADVTRFKALLARYPRAEERFFTEAERAYCRRHADSGLRFAGTFAAKEAVVKALGLGAIAAWARWVEISRNASGSPSVRVQGVPTQVALSISHDAGVAVAVAVAVPTPGS